MRPLAYGVVVASWDDVRTISARVAPLGWHVQVQLDGRDMPQYEVLLRELPTEVVIDHNGKFMEPVGIEHPAFLALLRLLDDGRSWVKLSAPYETSKTGAPRYADVSALARALAKHHPEHCLWASNWPHPGQTVAPSTAVRPATASTARFTASCHRRTSVPAAVSRVSSASSANAGTTAYGIGRTMESCQPASPAGTTSSRPPRPRRRFSPLANL